VLDPEPTEESILKILETSDYGRCVFQMDNDVVDHQVVNMLLEDDVTVAFHMNGFNSTQTRTIRLAGTEGEIWGDFKDGIVHYQRYGQAPQQVDTNEQKLASGGHGGGDMGLIYDMIRLYRGDDFDTGAITTIQRSVESHYLAFAAEASRLAGGQIVNMETFVTEIRENG
jgi:hypothetical protein